MKLKNVKGIAVTVAAVLSFSGCTTSSPDSYFPPDPTATPITLSKEQFLAVKYGLGIKLKDPYTASLGGLAASRDGKGIVTVCGNVNAKNSFGAYTGYQSFGGLLGPRSDGSLAFLVLAFGDTPVNEMAVTAFCRSKGLSAGA